MDKEQTAIKRFQAASDMSLSAYGQPLVICISGGKDSSVITDLAIQAGIPAEFLHNHTTADAPETVRFVRSEFRRLEALGYACSYHMPVYKGKRVSMWSLIPLKLMPPTRLVRYCCSVLKETGGQGRFIATGVRWAESAKRKNNRGIFEKMGSSAKDRITLSNDNDDRRMLFENCRLKAKRVVNPIIDWTDDDVESAYEKLKNLIKFSPPAGAEYVVPCEECMYNAANGGDCKRRLALLRSERIWARSISNISGRIIELRSKNGAARNPPDSGAAGGWRGRR